MDQNFQERLLGELVLFLGPLRDLAENNEERARRLAVLGWQDQALPAAQIADLIKGILSLYEVVVELIDNPPKDLNDIQRLLGELEKVIGAIQQIVDAAKAEGAGGPIEDLQYVIPDLLEGMAAEYLFVYHPKIYTAAVLLTLIRLPGDIRDDELRPVKVRDDQVVYIPTRTPKLQFKRILDLLQDPIGVLERAYFPNGLAKRQDAEAAADVLFPRISLLFHELRGWQAQYGAGVDADAGVDWGDFGNRAVPRMLTIASDPLRAPVSSDGTSIQALFGATLALASVEEALLPSSAALAIVPFGSVAFGFELPSGFKLGLQVDGASDGFAVGPGGFSFLSDGVGGSVHGSLSLGKAGTADEPAWRIGSETATRLELGSFSVAVDAGFSAGQTDVGFLITVGKSALVIAPGDGDGFLQKVLPKEGFSINFELAFGWSKAGGVHFEGGAGFEVTLPVHLSLFGVIDIESVSLGLSLGTSGLKLGIGGTINVHIGPVAAAIEKMGIQAALDFKTGNLGPANLSLGFKPPTGIGIVIEAGPVTGGGFISFDFDNQRYAGVLQLKLYTIGITAIGLLDTKLPDGKSGFSFLIIISVEFTPIQIGFGFTLNGVGGLAGIHRTIVTEVLREGLRSKALDNILFPTDPVRRATQLISDLRRVFPPKENRYIFGPMLKLGWGGFLEASLGLILEVPSPVRIVILGQVDAYFPAKEAAIIEIHLDVLGIIDFGEKLFSLDASLYDSRVALFSLSGDMAMRLSWGDSPSFAFSLGGLNPHFQPPPGFPTLRRLCLSLGYEDNPRIAIEAYFALTSNSFQFGARLELYAAFGSLSIRGYLGFDALFIFSPFSFIIDFEAGIELKLGSWNLAAIHLAASFSGPTPYHIVGEASVSLLFFSISVHVDFTFGEERREELPAEEVWPALQAAVLDRRNWSATLPSGARTAVKLTPSADPAVLLVDPVGAVSLRQKIVPLNAPIAKFNEHPVAGVNQFSLDDKSRPLVYEHFAPGAFRDLSDAEKISSPSFVDMVGGFTLGSDAIELGGGVPLATTIETKVIDAKAAVRSVDAYTPDTDSLISMAARAVASPLERSGLARFAMPAGTPAQVALEAELFIIADVEALELRDDITPPVSKGLAQAALEAYLRRHPDERGTLQVISQFDVEEAA